MSIVAIFFVLAGTFFFTTGVIGLLRFPDFYSRMQATGKGDTLGAVLVLTGLALYNLHSGFSTGNILVCMKLLFIAVFWFVATPTAIHALLRAAFDFGIMPWTKDSKPIIEWPPRKEGVQ